MAPGRLKPGWYLVGGALLVVAMWLGAPRLFRHLAFFRVRRVEIVGLRNLAPDAVMQGLKLPSRLSLFDDLQPIQARAAGLPGVVSVEVSRRLPGALVVRVREIAPVALVPRTAGMVMMDERGRVLPFDPTRSAPDLPVVPAADATVAGLLGRVREAEPGFFAQVESAERYQEDVVLAIDRQRFLFRPDAPAEVIRAVLAVSQDLNRKHRSFRELDGRFAGQVVVRRGGV